MFEKGQEVWYYDKKRVKAARFEKKLPDSDIYELRDNSKWNWQVFVPKTKAFVSKEAAVKAFDNRKGKWLLTVYAIATDFQSSKAVLNKVLLGTRRQAIAKEKELIKFVSFDDEGKNWLLKPELIRLSDIEIIDLKEEHLMKTYSFTYDPNFDGFGSTEFCAETPEEARELFEDWFKSEYNTCPETYSIEQVYNEADAREYGEQYVF